MKKIIKFLTAIGVLLLAAGCVRENSYDCPEEIEDTFNISLDFLLSDRNKGCVFMSEISAVDLDVYDDEEKIILSKHIEQEQLLQYKGVKLKLPAGKYNVVAWGNIDDNCVLNEEEEDPYGSSITYDPLGDRFGYSSGKIYYAPRSGAVTRSGEMPGCYVMNVDPETGFHGTLEFRPAHRIVNVYIEGYSGVPIIEFIGLPMGLSWLGMDRLVEGGSSIIVTIMKTTEPYEQDGVIYDYAGFDTFHFDGSNDIILQIISPQTGDVFYSVLLNDVIEEIYNPDEIEISILLKFTPAGVEVSVPEWHREDVDPGVGI